MSEFDFDAAIDDVAAEVMGGDEPEDTIISDEVDDIVSDEQSEEFAEETPEVVTKAPPASWAKDKHEAWSKVPDDAKEYIELREKQMLDGLEQYKQGNQYASEIQKTLEPYRGMMQQFGVNEHQAIQNLFGWNQQLTSGSIEERQQAFIRLGNDLGLIPREGQPQIDPRTQELQQRLDRIERQEQQRQQQIYQQNLSKVTQEVEAFASDPAHEYFEEVAEDVLMLLKSGLDLQAAYEKAVWANPVTRAKEQSKLLEAESKKLAEKKTAEAKAAMKAKSGNIKAANSTRTADSGPAGSWEETMQETLRAMRA
jgi:hypothetical protein